MSWRTQDNYSIGGFCLKLKLTDSPGIAGGFYWIHQQKNDLHLQVIFSWMRMTGLEPARRKHQNLNLARLPIPPHPHISYSIID